MDFVVAASASNLINGENQPSVEDSLIKTPILMPRLFWSHRQGEL